jgi:hypothetical protein
LFGWSKDLQQNLGLLRVETIFNSRNSKLKGIGANNNLSVGGIFHNAHLTRVQIEIMKAIAKKISNDLPQD